MPNDESAVNIVKAALDTGYRLIDTAKIYGNEAAIGKAINESGISRSEIFVTTKLWNDEQGYESTHKAFNESLRTLGLDYIDLYLIHWPVEKLRLDSWKALIKINKDGRTKSIGVSNFMAKHLKELFDNSDTLPQVNQIELSPYNYLYRKDVIDLCSEKNIAVEAYSPLTRGEKLNDPKLVEIAKRYDKSTAQILIRWCIQHDFVVIPKSENLKRIKENADIFDFEISSDDMNKLDNFNENLVTGWDPTNMN